MPETRVLITCPQMQRTLHAFDERLREAGLTVDVPPVVQALSEGELLPIIDRYDGMIAGDDSVTERVIAQAKRLRIISRWGVGVDGIDRAAADRAGIIVTNTPNAFGEEVADVALGYVIMLARQLHLIDRSVRDGGWAKPVGLTISGKVMGVVGLGSIGQAVARRAIGFGMPVLGFDPVESQRKQAAALGADTVDLDELLRRSRFVSLNCPLTAANRHMIGSAALDRMASDAFLINTARGPLVDERALSRAIEGGSIAGAGLDVFEDEPLPSDSPLRRFGNVILGSHNGSNTDEATMRVSQMAVNNLLVGLSETRA